jgi:hypothetical protein
MSTHPPIPSPTASQEEVEIKIVSHSHLFYWWPVWAVGFLMALLTLIDRHRMLVVHPEAQVVQSTTVVVPGEGRDEPESRGVVIYPKDTAPPLEAGKSSQLVKDTPLRRMANTSTYGVIYAITLLLVILITNVPLRGLWSVVIIVTVVLLSVIFGLAGWWSKIAAAFNLLDVRINIGGYVFISVVLFVIWLVTLLFFDRQVYMIFTPGQLRVCTEIGGGEKAYDTMGMTVEKRRSDLFRHWLLGLGSGDLIVNTAGAGQQQFDLPNVLFIGKKVQLIQDMLRERPIVKGR